MRKFRRYIIFLKELFLVHLIVHTLSMRVFDLFQENGAAKIGVIIKGCRRLTFFITWGIFLHFQSGNSWWWRRIDST